MLLHRNLGVFREIISEVAKVYGYQENQIEKDYYVSLFLKELLTISDLPIIFKGGTSLSKAYQLIDRFSEDLDIAVGFDGNRLSISKRKRLKAHILSTIENLSMALENEHQIESDRNFNQYEISFSRNFENTKDILSHILVETILPYQPYPCEKRKINNYVTQYLREINREDLIETYQLQPFVATVQMIERTLIDKLFAICDYYLENKISRSSRHIYDIHKIWNSNQLNKQSLHLIIDSVIKDRQLNGRKNFSSLVGAKPAEILKEIIRSRVFETDFINVTSNLVVKPITYDVCIISLEEILVSDLIPSIIQDFSN